MYPRAELMDAYRAALAAGLDVPRPDADYHDAVRVMERHGFLPRDHARVARVVASATERARHELEARAEADLIVTRITSTAARRARLARIHAMHPHRAIVVRTI